MSDSELVNCAKKMWDGMCEENKTKGYLLDGDKKLKFSTTSSVTAGSKNYGRFLEEKETVIAYMKKNAGPFLERYIKLCEKPVKVEGKR